MIFVDSNVLIDVMTEDPKWFPWSSENLARCADKSMLVINPVVYAEVSIRFRASEDLEAALPKSMFERELFDGALNPGYSSTCRVRAMVL